MKDEAKTFSIRLKKSLLELLIKESQNERRSLNNYITGILLSRPQNGNKK